MGCKCGQKQKQFQQKIVEKQKVQQTSQPIIQQLTKQEKIEKRHQRIISRQQRILAREARSRKRERILIFRERKKQREEKNNADNNKK